MAYRERLVARQQEAGRPVRVALVGAGQMGRGFIAQVSRIPGMEVAAVADVDVARGRAALAAAGVQAPLEGDDPALLAAAVDEGRAVLLPDAGLVPALPVDMVVEATGVPAVGAQVALAALLSGKDVGLLNVETDVTVGWLLASVARAAGRVYSVCRGDEPVEALKLVEYARDLDFEIVCAGKGKNNPLNRQATPASVAAEAARKRMNPKMLASFVDGTKTMIETAAMANATGLEVSRRGLNGVATTVDQLHEVFKPRADGGILERSGVVDYATGPVAPGVFVVVRSDDPTVVDEMAYLGMGAGPYYSFYRPYHLASIEAPLTVAAAALDRRPDLAPVAWKAEVVATAKRDLRAGEAIDGLGGECVYGVVDSAEVVREEGMLPLGLTGGAVLTRDVPAGQPLQRGDVEVDAASTIVQLRALQEQLLGQHGPGGLAAVLPVAGQRAVAVLADERHVHQASA